VASLGYYASVSGTKIAVVYSKSNFTADSANVTGGRDVSGLTLTGSANGGFTTPLVILATSNTGNTSEYGFALNAGNGVQLNAGDSLTIRVYFSCGSTSAGRYAVVKNVQAKGLTPVNLPLRIIKYEVRCVSCENNTTQLQTPNSKQILNSWTTANEINVSHFNVQRSINGRDFITIGKVTAQNKIVNEYSFYDSPPVEGSGVVFYRIESVDNDGRKQYSTVQQINTKHQTTKIVLFPNPASNFVTIDCKNARQISIIDGLGKVVYLSSVNNQTTTVDVKGMQKGLYIVGIITENGEELREKLVIR
jgi:ribosomal protein S27E